MALLLEYQTWFCKKHLIKISEAILPDSNKIMSDLV